jgi:hypothetical protein
MQQLCADEQCDGNLLAYARDVAGRTGSEASITGIQHDAAKLWSVANEVVQLDDDAQYKPAVDLALGGQADASAKLDAAITAESARAQARFDAAANDARSGFAVLAVALTLGLLLAGILVLVGLQPRIREYQ